MPHKYDEKMFDIKHLRKTAEKHNCTIGHIVKNPIDRLIGYHFKSR